jgi:DNA polymerase III epsilon subunit-like protein
MKYSIIDLETTGLNPYKHEIIEIGAIIFETNDLEPDLTVLEEINVRVKPEHPELGEAKAYEVNGYNPVDWADAQGIEDVLRSLHRKFMGSIFMSYNVTFDWSFIAHAYHTLGREDPFHYHHLDLMTMAWTAMPQGRSISLKSACEYFGIEPEPGVHRALNGAIKGFEVYKKISNKS